MDELVNESNDIVESNNRIEFVRFGKPVVYTEAEIIEQVDVFVQQQIEKGRIPTIEGFIIHLKVSEKSFRGRRAHNPVIEQAVAYIKLQQREEVIQAGMTAKNSRFHEFILNVNHGMKVEDNSGPSIKISLENPETVRRLQNIERKMKLQSGQTPEIVDVTDFELIE